MCSLRDIIGGHSPQETQRSLTVRDDSKTPYSDATQVGEPWFTIN